MFCYFVYEFVIRHGEIAWLHLSPFGFVFFSLAVNFKEVNEENKRELFSEVFSSIEALAFTFGNV